MTVYIECVIFNNFMIDYLVLYLSAIVNRRVAVWWRLSFAAFLGTGYAVVSPLIPYPYDVPLKIVSALVMILIAVKPIGGKAVFKYSAVFFAITFLLGGIVIGLTNIGSEIVATLTNPNQCYIGLISTVAVAILIIAKWIMRWRNIIVASDKLNDITLHCGKSSLIEKGLYDTGNRLYYKGIYPVIVIDDSIVIGKEVGKINVSTVAGQEKKPLYKIGRLTVNGKTFDSIYAIKNQLNQNYNVILHKDII